MRIWLVLLFCVNCSFGGEVRVAVASNFVGVAKVVGERFERSSGHKVQWIPGSTGKQYAQIVHGAPFDVWLAADAARPARLEREGKIVAGSRYTYALGRLVLAGAVDSGRLVEGDFRRLAVANPALAPYGAAARETMRKLGVWDRIEGKVVRGESVGQAWQFVKTGNAELGFVSASQVGEMEAWVVPEELYAPIAQQAVLLVDSAAGREFLAFLKSAEARKLIVDAGYGVPE